MVTNAWGEPVAEDDPESNPYWVPENQRKDTDDDPDANALLDPDTGVVSTDVDDD